MKKIIKLYDAAMELRLSAERARNDLCFTSDQQEQKYEELMFLFQEAESKLFTEIKNLSQKGKKAKKTKVEKTESVWPYPPTN